MSADEQDLNLRAHPMGVTRVKSKANCDRDRRCQTTVGSRRQHSSLAGISEGATALLRLDVLDGDS